MLVQFLKAYEAYAAGETAKFDKDVADKLIEKGYAEAAKTAAK